jgi:NADH:ubiquinone reductase (H+-translocating)
MPGSPHPRILVVGGGYVGMYAALRLQRRLRPDEASITVVDPQSYMTYQPFLPEAGAGNLEPRHVVVPLRRVLRRCRVLGGRVTQVDHARRRAVFEPHEGQACELEYDELILAPGSVARTLPIPGLREVGIGFKTVAEAIYLRNHVLSKLEIAASTQDPQIRRRALTFTFIGGGYAGIEAMAELEDMARDALRYYDGVSARDMRWVVVEASDRILPEVSREMSGYTIDVLERRGIEIKLNTRLESVVDGHAVLSTGERFDTETVVWTAGVRANPLLEHTDLPRDERNRLRCTAELRVAGVDGAWSAGDCAAVPDLSSDDRAVGSTCGAPGEAAGRQSPRVAARRAVEAVPACVRRLRRLPWSAQGCRRDLRRKAARVAGVVHAPDVPHDADADVQPQGARDRGLDSGVVLPARDRVAWCFRQPPRRVRASNATRRPPLTATISVLSRPDKTLIVTLNMGPRSPTGSRQRT